MISIAKLLIIGGVILIGLGSILFFFYKTGIPLGKLPGDIEINSKNSSIQIPITTCIFISIGLSILINLFLWFFKKIH